MPPRELTFRGGTLVFKPRKRLCYAELFRMLNHRGEFAADCVDNDNIALVNLAAEYLLSDYVSTLRWIYLLSGRAPKLGS